MSNERTETRSARPSRIAIGRSLEEPAAHQIRALPQASRVREARSGDVTPARVPQRVPLNDRATEAIIQREPLHDLEPLTDGAWIH